jgi:hypothetical protein
MKKSMGESMTIAINQIIYEPDSKWNHWLNTHKNKNGILINLIENVNLSEEIILKLEEKLLSGL